MGMAIRVLGLIIVAFVAIGLPARAFPQPVPGELGDDSVPGELVFRSPDAESLASLRSMGIPFEARELGGIRGLFRLRFRHPSTARLALETLSREPSVLYVEPNRRVTLAMPTTRVGEATDLWGASSMELPRVWSVGQTGSRNVLVGVLDTGIDWTHPDLQANLYSNPGEIPDNGVDDDGNEYVDDLHGWNFIDDTPDSRDDHKHGTHVAGIIGAVGGNDLGIAGVAWEVSLLPLKFLDERGRGKIDDAIEAIAYAARMGVRVVNCSFASRAPSAALEDTIRWASERGMTIVAAAGNDTLDIDRYPTYPASIPLPNVISVAAHDQDGRLAPFSNYGAQGGVTVAAPGVSILSTLPGGGYGLLSGTSMAAPHVAGLVSLLLSKEPTLSPPDIKERLVRSGARQPTLRRKVAARGTLQAWYATTSFFPANVEPSESEWIGRPEHLASSHPYHFNEDLALIVREPGARFLRVRFTRFQIEVVHDSLAIETPGGEVQELIQGEGTEYTSDYVDGDSLTLRFRSDFMTNQWGFEVDRVEAVF